MSTPTPIHINYGLLAINMLFQGFIAAIPGLLKIFISTWYLWEFFLLFIAVKIGYEIYQYNRLSKSGIFEIDKMTGEEFEERLQILFTNLGYEAKRTSPGKTKPDYGVDLVVQKDGIKTAIQAKCYRKQLVGEDAVREVLAGKNYYYCHKARVVTNGNYSRMARRLARVNNVELWSRNYLLKVLLTEQSLKTKPTNNLTS